MLNRKHACRQHDKMYHITKPCSSSIFLIYTYHLYMALLSLKSTSNYTMLKSSKELDHMRLICSPCQRSDNPVIGVTTEEFGQSVKSSAAKGKSCRAYDIER